jgi:hypothetical protein
MGLTGKVLSSMFQLHSVVKDGGGCSGSWNQGDFSRQFLRFSSGQSAIHGDNPCPKECLG